MQFREEIEYEKIQNEFFANLSHEFKTPLNLIFSGLQLLDNKIKNNNDIDEYKTYTNTIKQNSYRLLKLVNNLIDINKINFKAFNLNLQNYDIVNLIRDITDSIKSYAEDNNRELQFNSDIEERIIACDPFNIERIMLNLLSNAIKFTNKDDEIIVHIYEKKEKIIISVEDTGIGIPEEKQEIIFKRFGQVDTSFTRNSEGSGIGLSLVKKLVEMHEGEIGFKSKYGKGSEFIIKLPIKILEKDIKFKNREVEYDFINKVNVEFPDIYS
ncbi:sensor histidine kinase [Selenihalanaerobacter shriftii]|uniref:histidine kinase n=1 Tax=Selenihalanaerobacter shriftii TaxID=142842 RepID=A0A1T4PEN4_9FIRM|nr:HAMP domain-containing sensor histidine kinase [Selenihalanaerobacter shriftii]SJZ90004.1 His Kinase A (phospho-acceptor) domain-containing protein [Selenihalanaerobacter shriftii]